MPKLPDINDLGARPIPQASRPITSYRPNDGEALAQTGETLQRVGARMQERQDRLESAYAQSALLQDQLSAFDELKDDNDYTTYEKRFGERMTKALERSAGMISNPEQRAMFQARAQADIARGVFQVRDMSRTKAKDFGRAEHDTFRENTIKAALAAPDEPTRARLLQSLGDSWAGMVDRGWASAEEAAGGRMKDAAGFSTLRAMQLPPRERLSALSGISGEGFERAYQVVAKNEGGFTASDGASGAPAIYGINRKWHPEAFDEAKRLTDTQGEAAGKAYAQDFYKKAFWDANGMDSVPAESQAVVFDGVVNHRLAFAKRLVERAKEGATPEELIAMRREEYQRLGQSPAYAPSLPGWEARLKAVEAQGKGMAGDWTDMIPPEQKIRLREQAQAEIRKEQVVYRADLERRVKDSSAMAMQGADDPSPPTLDDFRRAYDDAEAGMRYREFEDVRQLGSNIQRVQSMTPVEQISLLEQSKPKPGAGFNQEQKAYETLVKAVETANRERQSDPVAFAQRLGAIPPEPLNFSIPSAMQEQLAQRASVIKSMSEEYGTPPALFSASEAKQFSAALNAMKTGDKLGFLQAFRSSIDDPRAYSAALQQIRPDSPVTAMAGGYLGLSRTMPEVSRWIGSNDPEIKPADVAARLLEGEALLNPPAGDKKEDGAGKRFPMPPDGTDGSPGLRQKFNDHVGDAFRGLPRSADQAYQAYRAFYAAEAARQGKYDGALDDDIAKLANRAVIGTVVEKNGTKSVAPWGMGETDFNDAAKARFDATVRAAGIAGVSWGEVGLQNTDQPGVYLIPVGTGYLSKDGRPLVLDLNAAPPRTERERLLDQIPRP
jgi:hypothetical protein